MALSITLAVGALGAGSPSMICWRERSTRAATTKGWQRPPA